MYIVERTPKVDRQLRKLPKDVALKIVSGVEKMAKDPFSRTLDVKKLSGRSGYRLRIGEYRVIYHLQRQKLLILLVEVGHRKEVYQ